MSRIDQYSLASLPIRTFFGDQCLALGTAFIWDSNNRTFLITNWHNVTGINPFTGKHLSRNASEPDRLSVLLNVKNRLGEKIGVTYPLRGENGEPLWWIHPRYRKNVDVVALPIALDSSFEAYAINKMDQQSLEVQVGMDAFVLGFPFDIGPTALPVWKRASIASEPHIFTEKQLYTYLDTTSRPGMSGSPVIRRSWVTHMLEGNNVTMGQETASRFIGVYSGRIAANDFDAQLGIMWPAGLLVQILAGNTVDTLPLF